MKVTRLTETATVGRLVDRYNVDVYYMWVKNLVKHPLCMAEVEVRRVSPEEEERCRMIRMGYFNLFHRG